MTGVALQVRKQSQTQRVLEVHPLDGYQVACHFGGALPEAHSVIFHSKLLRIVGESSKTLGFQAAKVFHGHLENFGFFKLR